MSTEKSPEMAGCNASIMKNAWEIREREFGMKMNQEQERVGKSALSTINKDWENRMMVRLGKVPRVEKKVPPIGNPMENENVWKSKNPRFQPTPAHGAGSNLLGRTGDQTKRGFSTQAANSKDRKGQNKYLNKLQLLMLISQTQPSAMVWGKSWKYNKSLPKPECGEAPPTWGKCWMFAVSQPYSEPGKPWLNGPNLMDPRNLELWKRRGNRMMESQELDLILPIEDWQTSWRKLDRNRKKEEHVPSGTKVHRFFTLLEKSQHRNEDLCASEWNESWRSTKPSSQEDDGTFPIESFAKNPDEGGELSSQWEECWMFGNHLSSKKHKLPKKEIADCPEWANSWSAATVASNNQKNSDPSLINDHRDNHDHGQQRESHLLKVNLESRQRKYRNLFLQLCDEVQTLSEWSKSWQVTKNNSKPSEEIEKLLKMKKNEQRHEPATERSEISNPNCAQKNHVIYPSKREFSKNLPRLKNVSVDSAWIDSWKTLKHRMRMERRRLRPDPLRPFRVSEDRHGVRPTAPVWTNSWRLTCQPLHQELEPWRQGWPTLPQIRVERATEQNHFQPVELPKNGPTGEQTWGESWRFRRPRHRSEPMHCPAWVQNNIGRSNVVTHHPDGLLTSRSERHSSHAPSVSDWQEAWMVSETQFHHDRPSSTQWRDAWRCSAFNTDRWTEQPSREIGPDGLMEMEPLRVHSVQTTKSKISRSFENQMFRERYPEKLWSTSWRAGSLLNHQPSYYGSTGKCVKSMSSTHHVSENGHGYQWGMSFRLANPMPQVKQPWVECSPNSRHYGVMGSGAKALQNNILNFINSPAMFKVWSISYRFLPGVATQTANQTSLKEAVDPWVILTHRTQTRSHLFSQINKEKKSERKWPGCHQLSKSQPRPKKGTTPANKHSAKDENRREFRAKWEESWRFLVEPGSLKKQMSLTPPSGWEESWKFLLPVSHR